MILCALLEGNRNNSKRGIANMAVSGGDCLIVVVKEAEERRED